MKTILKMLQGKQVCLINEEKIKKKKADINCAKMQENAIYG